MFRLLRIRVQRVQAVADCTVRVSTARTVLPGVHMLARRTTAAAHYFQQEDKRIKAFCNEWL